MHAVSDRLWAFAFKGENVGQKKFYTRVGHGRHHSPPCGNISYRSVTYSTSRSLVSTRAGSCARDGEQFFRKPNSRLRLAERRRCMRS